MFDDGLHDKVDIYIPIFGDNRIDKGEARFNEEPDIKEVSCRIHKDNSKIFFDGNLELKKGYKIVDNDVEYFVKDVKRVRGIATIHHITAIVESRLYNNK